MTATLKKRRVLQRMKTHSEDNVKEYKTKKFRNTRQENESISTQNKTSYTKKSLVPLKDVKIYDKVDEFNAKE